MGGAEADGTADPARFAGWVETVRLEPAPMCGIHRCEPGWTWRPQRLPDHVLWFVVAGRGRMRLDTEADAPAGRGGFRPLHPGSLLWLRPGDGGRFSQDDDHRLTVLACHFDALDRVHGRPVTAPDDRLPPRVMAVGDISPLAGLLRHLIRVNRWRTPLGLIEARGLLLQIVAEIGRQQAAASGRPADRDHRLDEAVELITMAPSERPRLDEIAAAVGVSGRQLSRLFTEQLQMSFRDFVVESRLQRSRTLLAETELTIHQVARALGYPDHVLFSRQFHHRFGQPPSAYRTSVLRMAARDMSEGGGTSVASAP